MTPIRARQMALGLLLTLALTPVSTLSVTSAPAAAAESDPTWAVPLRVGTYNFQYKRSLDAFKKAMDALVERVDVAGLQETRTLRRNGYLEKSAVWGSYRPSEDSPNPVIWDKRVFRFIEGNGYLLARGRSIGNEREHGRGVSQDSFATVVRLQHLTTGENVSIINVHLVAGAVRKGKPWRGRPRLFRMYQEQVANAVRAERIERKWGRVFVLGDLNIGYRVDRRVQRYGLPYRRLTRRGLDSMWKGYNVTVGGTKGDSYLDQVWADQRAADATVARDIRGSDHFPAIATYTLDLLPDLPTVPEPPESEPPAPEPPTVPEPPAAEPPTAPEPSTAP